MSSTGYSVVLIDDDPEFLRGTEMYLTSEGFRVFAFAHGKKALQTIRRLEPDAVLLDYDMPEATGLEILARLRAMSLTRSVPVMFLTAARDPDLLSRGFRAGLDDYLSKPFRGEELALRLRAIIQRRRAALSADPDRPPENTNRILILQATYFAAFARANRPELAELRGVQARLLHRLRDPAGENHDGHIPFQRRRDGIILLFPGENQAPPERLKRALAAANRLPVLNQAPEFLAPASANSRDLVPYPWPRFRLLDARLSHGASRDLSDLPERLALELDDHAEQYRAVEI